ESNDLSKSAERKIRFSYDMTVENIPANSKYIEIWLPVPKSDRYQTISDVNISCDYPYTFQNEPEYDNLILAIKGNNKIPESVSVSMDFMVTRTGYSLSDKSIAPNEEVNPAHLKRYLLPDRLVPVSGLIAEETQKILNNDLDSLGKVRVIYDHVVSTMVYDKTGKGWGRGDAVYACNARKGNCTDFHSLFIGMARAIGIPARFVIGFPIPEGKKQGSISGYHCWAEFYINGLGWIPIDASEASKHTEKQDFFFGGLDANRVQFTTGRDIRLKHNPEIEPINYFIYPYVQINGKVHTDIECSFWFNDLTE
ncbi:MAG: transglutaminase-like domain-containing protein, partial [Candidatus Anammoxibacter sp.]